MIGRPVTCLVIVPWLAGLVDPRPPHGLPISRPARNRHRAARLGQPTRPRDPSEDGYVKDDVAKVMGFVEFNGGHRYTDFIPGTDKVAEYGIAAAAFLRKLFSRKPTDAAAKP